jgi:hypothetical protein
MITNDTRECYIFHLHKCYAVLTLRFFNSHSRDTCPIHALALITQLPQLHIWKLCSSNKLKFMRYFTPRIAFIFIIFREAVLFPFWLSFKCPVSYVNVPYISHCCFILVAFLMSSYSRVVTLAYSFLERICEY